ncbi:MAG TPA: glucose 1-dehydrogenase [Cytophagales bacterium]|nr:glucose 1-dehydrogenase [Cytophagales bacterium]
MKAISLLPGTHDVDLLNVAEPEVRSKTQVKIRILEVGVCGTDREQVEGGRADAPTGAKRLILGHEMFGQVVETGPEVTKVSVGDYGVFSVRRGCGKCVPCQNNRSDMCYTGNYTERGIKGLHGFDAEYVVDEEQYLVKVPVSIKSIGVLAEPMSVAEKAIDEALNIQESRLPKITKEEWIVGKKALVVGMGAIGILAAVALRLRGAEVLGLDIVDENTNRPSILKRVGGYYLDGRKIKASDIDKKFGQVDFIFEAAGVASLGFEIIDALGINGIYVMTGIPHEARPVCITGAQLMKQIVLKNQIIIGSVNAGPTHFQLAIDDLEKAKNKWGDLMDEIITTRVGYDQFKDALELRTENDIKTVIVWD